MKLTPMEAEELGRIWDAARMIFNLMEDMRPGGGFKEAIDTAMYCKECGKPMKEGK